jgi:hypothetical protein
LGNVRDRIARIGMRPAFGIVTMDLLETVAKDVP